MFVVISMSFPVFLSARIKTVYVEAFGASGTVGVNFDTRFKGNSGFGVSDSGEMEFRPGVDELSTQWEYDLFGNIGYRFKPVRGVTFRVGVTPSFTFGDRNIVLKSLLYPCLSVGYAF